METFGSSQHAPNEDRGENEKRGKDRHTPLTIPPPPIHQDGQHTCTSNTGRAEAQSGQTASPSSKTAKLRLRVGPRLPEDQTGQGHYLTWSEGDENIPLRLLQKLLSTVASSHPKTQADTPPPCQKSARTAPRPGPCTTTVLPAFFFPLLPHPCAPRASAVFPSTRAAARRFSRRPTPYMECKELSRRRVWSRLARRQPRSRETRRHEPATIEKAFRPQALAFTPLGDGSLERTPAASMSPSRPDVDHISGVYWAQVPRPRLVEDWGNEADLRAALQRGKGGAFVTLFRDLRPPSESASPATAVDNHPGGGRRSKVTRSRVTVAMMPKLSYPL
ncbi:unnamed protein product [Boreogadus saida]